METDQIEEWIREVEERPTSAPVMMRFIANRMRALTSRNEELLAENIELRSGRKVEDYENRIANLEYQLEMLKRQLSGEVSFGAVAKAVEAVCLIAYLPQGRVLRYDHPIADLTTWGALACLPEIDPSPWFAPRLVVTSPYEEMLFIFDSGRTVTVPVADLPAASKEGGDWNNGYLVEPRGGEELVAALPIGKMTLFDFSLQTSRRGCARKMMRASFESHIAKGFVGTGVKQKPDRTGSLVLSGKTDTLVMVSWEGFVTCAAVESLSYNAEEMLRLSATDHIVSSYVLNEKSTLVTVTNNGKVLGREPSWLDRSTTAKSRGQALYSPSRREGGVRVAGAAAANSEEWGAALLSDGRVMAFSIGEALAAGALQAEMDDLSVVDFVLFGVAVPRGEGQE